MPSRGRSDITLAGSHCRDPPATMSQAGLQARAGSSLGGVKTGFGGASESLRLQPRSHSEQLHPQSQSEQMILFGLYAQYTYAYVDTWTWG